MIGGVQYEKIDDQGLHLRINDTAELLALDTVIVCAGQESKRTLYDELQAKIDNLHIIGGAEVAMEIDAKLAIDRGCRLAAEI